MNANPAESTLKEPLPRSECRGGERPAGGWVWFRRHPRLAVVIVAALAVICSSYPIIFCGKSYASPTNGWQIIYDQFPWVPGAEHQMYHSQHGSDTSAMLLYEVPIGFIESRSILDYGEIPLWNRYGHAGDILLGQAISMLGDPLHLIVILGRGSALAWDVKFLLAKLLFCIGFGWLVLRLLDNVALAAIFAALGAYCGAYIFIATHPVFFALAYAPWVLLSAMEMLGRAVNWLWWAMLWLAANVSCFNAGHVETAVILIGALNLAALINALVCRRDWRDRARILARLGGGTLLFLGLTAPVWMSFVAALPQAYTVHSEIKVTQLPPTSFFGLFDDYFYHCYWKQDLQRLAPGTSLLVLAGCLLSLRRWRYLREAPFFWVNSGASLFWMGCVFGLVPGGLIALVPFLNRVGHVYVDISYLLVIHLTLQSAYGFKSLLESDGFRKAAVDFVAITIIMESMLIAYYLISYDGHHYLAYFMPCAAGAIGAPMLFKYLLSRNRRIGVLGWTGIVVLGFIPNFRFGLYTFGDDDLMMLPGPRMVLNPPLATLDKLGNGGEPFRIAGTGMNLAGDYAAVYDREGIYSYAPLSNGRYIQLLQGFPGIAPITKDSCMLVVMDPAQAQPLLNLLNVKYLLANPHTPPPETGKFTVSNPSDFTVMENNQAWPRAFFTTHIVPVSSNEEFVRQLLNHGDHPFAAVDREQADREPPLRRLEQESEANIVAADHYQLLPNSTAFDIRATAPGVVCLTEGQADDFLARANGKSVKVLTVNRAFKGVYLDQPGNYHLEFRFRPRHWNTSISLFWFSLGMVLILGARELKRKKFKSTGGWLEIAQIP